MQLHPISSAGGAVVKNVNLSKPIPSDMKLKLQTAFTQYNVLVFKGQDLTEKDQFRFCEVMGGLGVRGKPRTMRQNDLDSEYAGALHLVTNLTKDGKPLGSFGDGEVWFHHDGIFKQLSLIHI